MLRHPTRNGVSFLLAAGFFGGLACFFFVQFREETEARWIAIASTAVAAFCIVAAWEYFETYEIYADRIVRERVLHSTSLEWASVTGVDDFGSYLTIRSSMGKMIITGDVNDWEEFRAQIGDWVPSFSEELAFPLTVRRGWRHQLIGGGSLAALWIMGALLAGLGIATFAIGLSLVAGAWLVYAFYWRATRWIFDEHKVVQIRPFGREEHPASEVVAVRIENQVEDFYTHGVRIQYPLARLAVEIRYRPPIVIPSQHLDVPVESIRRTLVRRYGLGG